MFFTGGDGGFLRFFCALLGESNRGGHSRTISVNFQDFFKIMIWSAISDFLRQCMYHILTNSFKMMFFKNYFLSFKLWFSENNILFQY